MKVLLTVASRHGSTNLVADAIREELETPACRVHLSDPDLVANLVEYDAVVLGSAVYAGHWLRPAVDFARRFEAELCTMPVWLFSSGPIGEPPIPSTPPIEALEWSNRLGARGHQVFAGRLDRQQLGFGERLAVRLVNAPDGDFRPWLEIGRWARSIRASLETAAATGSPARRELQEVRS
jgi:menaquinone-dependent protoporphyrinogen oxidase